MLFHNPTDGLNLFFSRLAYFADYSFEKLNNCDKIFGMSYLGNLVCQTALHSKNFVCFFTTGRFKLATTTANENVT